jgi:hypothetical protein
VYDSAQNQNVAGRRQNARRGQLAVVERYRKLCRFGPASTSMCYAANSMCILRIRTVPKAIKPQAVERTATHLFSDSRVGAYDRRNPAPHANRQCCNTDWQYYAVSPQAIDRQSDRASPPPAAIRIPSFPVCGEQKSFCRTQLKGSEVDCTPGYRI